MHSISVDELARNLSYIIGLLSLKKKRVFIGRAGTSEGAARPYWKVPPGCVRKWANPSSHPVQPQLVSYEASL